MRHAEHVMGTVVSFDLRPGDLDHQAVREALSEACAALHEADAQLSTWKPQSALSRMRRGELDLADAPACVAEVLRPLRRGARALRRLVRPVEAAGRRGPHRPREGMGRRASARPAEGSPGWRRRWSTPAATWRPSGSPRPDGAGGSACAIRAAPTAC